MGQITNAPSRTNVQEPLCIDGIEHLLNSGATTTASTICQRANLLLLGVKSSIELVLTGIQLICSRVKLVDLVQNSVDDILNIDIDRILQIVHFNLQLRYISIDLSAVTVQSATTARWQTITIICATLLQTFAKVARGR